MAKPITWILAGALTVVCTGASLGQNLQNMQGYGGAQSNPPPGALNPNYAPFHGVGTPTVIPSIRRQTLGDAGLPGGLPNAPSRAAQTPETCAASDCGNAGGLTPFGAKQGGLTPFGAKQTAPFGATAPYGATGLTPYGAPQPAPVGAAEFTPYGTAVPTPQPTQ